MTLADDLRHMRAVRHAISEIVEIAELLPNLADAGELKGYGKLFNDLFKEAKNMKLAYEHFHGKLKP